MRAFSTTRVSVTRFEEPVVQQQLGEVSARVAEDGDGDSGSTTTTTSRV
jgi:hypothetical protein